MLIFVFLCKGCLVTMILWLLLIASLSKGLSHEITSTASYVILSVTVISYLTKLENCIYFSLTVSKKSCDKGKYMIKYFRWVPVKYLRIFGHSTNDHNVAM
jgi:hypothetical protein